MNEEQVRAKVCDLAREAGGCRALAKKLGVCASYVSDVTRGRRAPGPPFLKALGLEKVVEYRAV